MELKQNKMIPFVESSVLLIVPYGIETSESGSGKSKVADLLIVPYGIETELESKSTSLDNHF